MRNQNIWLCHSGNYTSSQTVASATKQYSKKFNTFSVSAPNMCTGKFQLISENNSFCHHRCYVGRATGISAWLPRISSMKMILTVTHIIFFTFLSSVGGAAAAEASSFTSSVMTNWPFLNNSYSCCSTSFFSLLFLIKIFFLSALGGGSGAPGSNYKNIRHIIISKKGQSA